jgi:ADP-ribose pyrophosphatase YjhB (NUDIX family)
MRANRSMSEAFERGLDGRSSDLPSGGGVPRWIAASMNFCPRCGGQLTFESVAGEDRDRHACRTCGHIMYVNPRLVVTTLPITEAGEIVLIRRGIEPGIGSWAQPGGFLEVDETVNQGAIRETFEETGLLVEPGEIIGLYTRLEAAVVTIVFEARIVGGVAAPTLEATEIKAYPAEAIPWDQIAFRTTFWALRDWLSLRRPDVEPGPPNPYAY